MAPVVTLTLGQTVVHLYAGYTVSLLPDGTVVHARHDDVAQVGQRAQALALGYPDEQAMNRDHDPLHHLLALWLRWPMSPTLQAAGRGHASPLAWQEEAVVLALQRLCVALEIDILALAQSYSLT
jgi:hypothetical protein